jgi:hypothetical protein
MKRICTMLFLVMAISRTALCQLNESFADGDFTSSPAWGGSTTEWQVVLSSDVAAGATNSNTLRLSASGGSGTEYLSTQLLGAWGLVGQTWAFWLGRRGQSAGAANASYVWLYASEANLTSSTVDGYRIRFGDDTGDDEIVLESVTNGVATTVITSLGTVPDGLTDIGFLVRVTHTVAGTWTLYTSVLPTVSGTGDVATANPNVINTSILQGTATNTDYTVFTNGYVGVAASHTSSAAARAGAEFDQIRVVFAANALLPAHLSGIKVYQKLQGVQIDWIALSQDGLDRYEIERSLDGNSFDQVGTVASINNGNDIHYGFFDGTPLNGLSFYRIKMVDISGKISYSIVLRIDIGSAISDMLVYPNPARVANSISISAGFLPQGEYRIVFASAIGQQVYSTAFYHPGGAFNQTVTLREFLVAGNYVITLKKENIMLFSRILLIK